MRKKEWIRNISAIIVVAAMVMAAELLHEKEIIFPEITALATGALVAPKRSWQTNRLLMVALIAVCSVTGVLIVQYIPMALWELLYKGWFTLPTTLHRLTVHLWQK